jgi:hypothetical protein
LASGKGSAWGERIEERRREMAMAMNGDRPEEGVVAAAQAGEEERARERRGRRKIAAFGQPRTGIGTKAARVFLHRILLLYQRSKKNERPRFAEVKSYDQSIQIYLEAR